MCGWATTCFFVGFPRAAQKSIVPFRINFNDKLNSYTSRIKEDSQWRKLFRVFFFNFRQNEKQFKFDPKVDISVSYHPNNLYRMQCIRFPLITKAIRREARSTPYHSITKEQIKRDTRRHKRSAFHFKVYYIALLHFGPNAV